LEIFVPAPSLEPLIWWTITSPSGDSASDRYRPDGPPASCGVSPGNWTCGVDHVEASLIEPLPLQRCMKMLSPSVNAATGRPPSTATLPANHCDGPEPRLADGLENAAGEMPWTNVPPVTVSEIVTIVGLVALPNTVPTPWIGAVPTTAGPVHVVPPSGEV
jgi:hypothetical protein